MVATDMMGRLDITIKVEGGGITGQAGACCQGVARALKVMFGLETATQPVAEGQAPVDENIVNMAKKLRDSGYLTRDGRMKERKKYGRKGARKSFQFSKR
jgi:small subunit ribosomal protein S9